MSNPVVRAAQVFYKNKKVAEMNEGSLEFAAGRTMLFGSEGYLCHSKGAGTSRGSFKVVRPQAGVSISDVQDCLAQNDVDIMIVADGKRYRQTMAVTSVAMSWNTQSGVFEGTISIEGGPMKVT